MKFAFHLDLISRKTKNYFVAAFVAAGLVSVFAGVAVAVLTGVAATGAVGVAAAVAVGVATADPAGRAPLSSLGFSTTFFARRFSIFASFMAIA